MHWPGLWRRIQQNRQKKSMYGGSAARKSENDRYEKGQRIAALFLTCEEPVCSDAAQKQDSTAIEHGGIAKGRGNCTAGERAESLTGNRADEESAGSKTAPGRA